MSSRRGSALEGRCDRGRQPRAPVAEADARLRHPHVPHGLLQLCVVCETLHGLRVRPRVRLIAERPRRYSHFARVFGRLRRWWSRWRARAEAAAAHRRRWSCASEHCGSTSQGRQSTQRVHRAGSSFGEGPGGWKQRPLSSGLFLQVAHICCCASWHRCFRRELPNRQLSDASVGLVGFILQITIVSVSAAISTRLTASHPNSEVKLVRAGVVLRWGTTREGPVLRFCCFALSDTLAASWLPFVLHPHRGSPAARRKSERKRKAVPIGARLPQEGKAKENEKPCTPIVGVVAGGCVGVNSACGEGATAPRERQPTWRRERRDLGARGPSRLCAARVRETPRRQAGLHPAVDPDAVPGRCGAGLTLGGTKAVQDTGACLRRRWPERPGGRTRSWFSLRRPRASVPRSRPWSRPGRRRCPCEGEGSGARRERVHTVWPPRSEPCP